MSLRFKLLITLYVAVGAVWLVHTMWELHTFERAYIAAEVRATRQLGSGLRLYFRELSSRDELEETLRSRLRGFERDVMVINRDFEVVAASDPDRLGRTWIEPGIEAVMRGQDRLAYNDHEHDGHRVLDVSMAVEGDDGQTAYVIHVARRQDVLEAELAHHRRDDALMLIAAFAVMAVLVTGFTHRMILRPLARIEGRIRKTPWGGGVEDREARDLHSLEHAVHAMLERIEDDRTELQQVVEEKSDLLDQVHGMKDALEVEVDRVRKELQAAEKSLLRAERHAALGQLSGALAHELRNPLHIVRGLAETAGRRQPEVTTFTDDIKAEVDRIDQLIRGLLQYTRPLDFEFQEIAVGGLLDDVCSRVSRVRADRGQAPCRIAVSSESDVIHGDPVLLEQALENLLENACDASGPDGEVRVREIREDACSVVSIHDSGPGIAEEDIDKVLEPFFTRKAAGTGLGLCVAQRIIELHGGELALANHPDGGLIATVHLPPLQGVCS